MGKLNFILKKSNGPTSPIMAVFCIYGRRKAFSIKQSIPKKLWSKSKQRAKNTPGYPTTLLNSNLDRIEKVFEAYKMELSNQGNLNRGNVRFDLLLSGMKEAVAFKKISRKEVLIEKKRNEINSESPYMSKEQVAAYFKVSVYSIDKWMKVGKVIPFKFGRKCLFLKSSLPNLNSDSNPSLNAEQFDVAKMEVLIEKVLLKIISNLRIIPNSCINC